MTISQIVLVAFIDEDTNTWVLIILYIYVLYVVFLTWREGIKKCPWIKNYAIEIFCENKAYLHAITFYSQYRKHIKPNISNFATAEACHKCCLLYNKSDNNIHSYASEMLEHLQNMK